MDDILFERKAHLPPTVRQVCGAQEVKRIAEDREPTWKPLVMNQVLKFPVDRRPEQRELSTASQGEVDEWFTRSGITIGDAADTSERQVMARRLLYTWKDCFADRIRDVKPTDLIQHSIDLLPNARPKKEKMQRYTQKEREFAAKIFPEMEEAGVIVRGSSDWGARTKFPPKKETGKLRGQDGSDYTTNEKKTSSCRLARLRQTYSCPL